MENQTQSGLSKTLVVPAAVTLVLMGAPAMLTQPVATLVLAVPVMAEVWPWGHPAKTLCPAAATQPVSGISRPSVCPSCTPSPMVSVPMGPSSTFERHWGV